MKRSMLHKDIRAEIRKSFGRYISIFLIVALGVAFFSGLRATEADMRYTADAFCDEQQLMDLRVISTMGLTEEDVKALQALPGVDRAEAACMKDVLTGYNENEYVIQLHSKPQSLNLLQVTEGRLPEAPQEILLDNRLLKSMDYQIGDTITFTSGTEEKLQESLTRTEFTIVGYGDSPLFIGIERGSSLIGNGQVSGFAVVLPEVFDLEYYTQIYLTASAAFEQTAFTDGYSDAVEPVRAAVEAIEQERCSARLEEIAAPIREELEQQETEYDKEKTDAENTLADARSSLDDAWSQLEAGKTQLQEQEEALSGAIKLAGGDSSAFSEQLAALETVRQQLEASEAELTQKEAEYQSSAEEAQTKLAEGREKLDDAWEELNSMKLPEWSIIDRDGLMSYTDFGDNAVRMGAIGKVFPAIFFLVAALVALTAITRMVEEQRVLIGTYKALGYSKLDAMKKYLIYALSATAAGSILGVLAGEKLFPFVIIISYRIIYSPLQKLVLPYDWYYSVLSAGLAVGSVTIAAIAACYRELAAQPAILMRPAAPKPGKRVFLEHIGIIWKHISFSQKNTFRNLFRYKKRLIMTVFGIGCCCGLLIVGFGLQDSIMKIASLQYDNIQLYDAMAALDTEKLTEHQEALEKQLAENDQIEDFAEIMMKSMDAETENGVRTAYTVVCREPEALEHMMVFRDRGSGEKYELTDKGVILSEQMAEALGVGEGDFIRLGVGTESAARVQVSHVAENYLMHYVYMTESYYEECFGTKPDYNMYWLNLSGEGLTDQDRIGKELMASEAVLTVTYVSSTRETIDGMLASLNIIVLVLVISASLLAFIVIYNLNNINISERRRELATLKLLGFYNTELAMYVYRENIYLTLLGAAVGILIGRFLHGFIIDTIQVNQVMFGQNVSVMSYCFSILLTVLFSAAVNGVMYFQLKKIDMIESLKSVE